MRRKEFNVETKILAIVDGREITQEHLAFLLQTIGPERAKQFQSEDGQAQLIQELINQELFYSYALEQGLDQHDSYLNEVAIVKANLLKSYAVRRFLNDVIVEQDEVQAFYDENPSQFKTPETVQASHILVATEEDAMEVKSALSEGLTFEEAALKYSSCPSKDRGGDLGQFGRGQMVPEFEAAAFSLDLNTISEPVKTQFGFHLIRVANKNDGGVMSFDEVKDKVKQHLEQQKQNTAYFNQIDALKKQFSVTVQE